MSRLITASLVGSIDWLNKCPPSWKERAFEDLRKQLAREYDEVMPLTMKRGIEFERAVQKHSSNTSGKGTEYFRWFVKECEGGVFQKKIKRFIDIDDEEYCLYGKIDVWFKNVIKDLKTTGRYGGKQKYLSTFQHELYCYIERIPNFRYLIAEFLEESNTIVAHYEIPYTVTNWEALHKSVVNTVKNTMKFLMSDKELFELYTTSFSRY